MRDDRNSLLVGLEAPLPGLSHAWHEAIGLAALAIVIGLTLRVMGLARCAGAPT